MARNRSTVSTCTQLVDERQYAEQMYAENRLMNATYGAEAFHRLTQNERYMEPTQFQQLLDAT
jgi:hypothetical protein